MVVHLGSSALERSGEELMPNTPVRRPQSPPSVLALVWRFPVSTREKAKRVETCVETWAVETRLEGYLWTRHRRGRVGRRTNAPAAVTEWLLTQITIETNSDRVAMRSASTRHRPLISFAKTCSTGRKADCSVPGRTSATSLNTGNSGNWSIERKTAAEAHIDYRRSLLRRCGRFQGVRADKARALG